MLASGNDDIAACMRVSKAVEHALGSMSQTPKTQERHLQVSAPSQHPPPPAPPPKQQSPPVQSLHLLDALPTDLLVATASRQHDFLG